ncbi:MAG: Hsp20/alpha crystallin family protein [Nanoarchaeota archaeon]|nr:Hsp20/alpha crystallin family protein [Nanoarchaeota archaeon]MCG2718910.1 Hsp20/alpha crystallin family protein [Nanoarchaeota archaeon]
MVRSIPPRTMRDIWDEEKKRAGSNLLKSVPLRSTMRDWYDKENDVRQKYSSQINSNKTSGTSGALYKKGRLKSQSVQGQSRNVYKSGGSQGTIFPKKLENNRSRTKRSFNSLGFKLDEIIENIEAKIFETSEKTNVIFEICSEKITNVSYDAKKEELTVHADKEYNIPLGIKEVDTKSIEWSYHNGIIEVTLFKNSKNY